MLGKNNDNINISKYNHHVLSAHNNNDDDE